MVIAVKSFMVLCDTQVLSSIYALLEKFDSLIKS